MPPRGPGTRRCTEMTHHYSIQRPQCGATPPPTEIREGAEAPDTGDDQRTPAALLVDVRGLARLTSLSVRTLWRRVSAGAMPPPLKIGGRTLWRIDDIRDWVDDGCPRSRR